MATIVSLPQKPKSEGIGLYFNGTRPSLFLDSTFEGANNPETKTPLPALSRERIEALGNYLERVKLCVKDTLIDLILLSGETRSWIELRASEKDGDNILRISRSIFCQEILKESQNREVLSAPFTPDRLVDSLSFFIPVEQIVKLAQADKDLELSDILLTLGCLSSDQSWNEILQTSLAIDISRTYTVSEPSDLDPRIDFSSKVITKSLLIPQADEEVFELQGILKGISTDSLPVFRIEQLEDQLPNLQIGAAEFLAIIFQRRHLVKELVSSLSLYSANLDSAELPEEITSSLEYNLAVLRARFASEKPPEISEIQTQARSVLSELISDSEIEGLLNQAPVTMLKTINKLDSMVNSQEGIQALFQGLLRCLGDQALDPSALASLANGGLISASWASTLNSFQDLAETTEDSSIRIGESKKPGVIATEAEDSQIQDDSSAELNSRNRPNWNSPSGLLVRLDDLLSSYVAKRQFTAQLSQWNQHMTAKSMVHVLPADDFIPLLSALSESIRDFKNNTASASLGRSYSIDHNFARSSLVQLILESPKELARLNQKDYKVRGWMQGDYKGPEKWVYTSGKQCSVSGFESALSLLCGPRQSNEVGLALLEAIKKTLEATVVNLSDRLEMDKGGIEKFLHLAWLAQSEDPLDRVSPQTIATRALLTIAYEHRDSQSYYQDLIKDPQSFALAILHTVIRPYSSVRAIRIDEAAALQRILESLRSEVVTTNANPSSVLQDFASEIVDSGFVNKMQILLDSIRSGSFLRENDGGRFLRDFLRKGSETQLRRAVPTIPAEKLPSANSVSGIQLRLSRACNLKNRSSSGQLQELKHEASAALKSGLLSQVPTEAITQSLLQRLTSAPADERSQLEKILAILARGTSFGVHDLLALRGQDEEGIPVYSEPVSCQRSSSGNSDALSLILYAYAQSIRNETASENIQSLQTILDDIFRSGIGYYDKLAPSRILPFDALISLAIFMESREADSSSTVAAYGILKLGLQHPDYARELIDCFDPSIQNPAVSKLHAQLEQAVGKEKAAKVASNFLNKLSIFGLNKNTLAAANPAEAQFSNDLLLYWSQMEHLPSSLLAAVQTEVSVAKEISKSDLQQLFSPSFSRFLTITKDESIFFRE